jgi:glyoxylase-like metal-dependent hydrolase (beta-lactamase superfamily II)
MTFSVRVVKMGQCDVPGPEVFWMSHWDQWFTLYFYMVVIQGGGKTAVINTGPPADLTALNEVWKHFAGDRCQLRRQEAERPAAALAAVGVDPAAVDYVLITPLQAYATANVTLFPNAQVCLSKRGWIEDYHVPKWPMHIPRELRIPDPVVKYLQFEAPDKLRLLDEEDEIIPGLRAWWAGVHHRSSMAYAIDTARGTVIATDSVFKYGNVEQNHPLGIMESMEECFRTYARLSREADLVIPLYDPEVLDRCPGGVVA